MAAARVIAEWATTLELDDVPDAVREDAKLHVLDTLGCGLAAHATGVAHEGRSTMSELGGVPQATVIGLEARLPAANAAFANAMLCHGLDFDDTHSDSVSHVSTVIAPAALAAAEEVGASGRDALAAIVAGNEITCRIGMAAPGRVPRARLPPDRDLRDLRRRRRRGPARRARRRRHDERARDRRLVRRRPLRVPRRGHADEADAPRLGGARRASRGAARDPRRGRARLGARGEVRPLPRVPRRGGRRDRHRRAARRPRQPLGDAADRLQAVPRLPLHARLARRGRRGRRGPHVRARRDRGRARDDPRGGRARSCSSRPRRSGRPARSTRASSRSRTRSPRCSSAATSPSATSPTRRSPTRPCSRSPAKVRYETRDYPTYPQAFPGGVVVRLADGTVVRGGLPVPEGRAGEPALAATRCARSSARTPRSRSRTPRCERLEQAMLSPGRAGRRHAALAPLSSLEAVPA